MDQRFAVAFDDGNWQTFPQEQFDETFDVIPSERETGYDAIRAVLINKKGQISRCSGFFVSGDES
eukprot:1594729-Pleurochrysis_carterae.AAC.1